MKEHELDRDIELENIVGNLLIAEYQVDRLRAKLIEKIDVRYDYTAGKKLSTHIFKNNDRWVKISLKVEEMTMDKSRTT